MKTSSLFITALVLLIFPKIKAQELIASDGGTVYLSHMQIDYALGEIAISTTSTDNKVWTEGLLQPRLLIKEWLTYYRSEAEPDFEISVFPNPTANYCEIQFSAPLKENFLLQLRNINSEIILHNSIPRNTLNYSLNMSDIPAGPYIISIYDLNENINASYRIIKVQ